MYVIPKSGLTIPDPDLNDYLPPEGRDVPLSAYWQRRIKDGDVIKGNPPSTKAKPKPKQEAAPDKSGSDT